MAERRRRGEEAADGRRAGDSRREDNDAELIAEDSVEDVEDTDLEDSDLEDVSEDLDDEAEDEDDADGVASGVGRGGTATKARPKSAAESGKSTKTKAPGKVGIFGRFANFVREVVAELRKVIWPTRTELLTYTTVVVLFVAIMLTVVGLLDLGFAKAVLYVFGSGGGGSD